MLTRILRILTFRADTRDYECLDPRYLVLGLAFTWLVGIGRYWDNPRVEGLQSLGLGSVAYVFALSALLWLVGLGMKPARWGYLNVLTFVTLTAPPGFLYAIPIERALSPAEARAVNLVFLAVVATWRVALYATYLRRYAALPVGPLVVQLLLPLTFVVTALAALNLEHAVFDLMGGVRETTSADSAYGFILALGLLSVVLFPLLLAIYVVMAIQRRRVPRPRNVA